MNEFDAFKQRNIANLYLAGALAPLLVDVHQVVESVGIEMAEGVLVGHDERRVVPDRLAVALLRQLVPVGAKAFRHQGGVGSWRGPGLDGSVRLLGPGPRVSGVLDLAEL